MPDNDRTDEITAGESRSRYLADVLAKFEESRAKLLDLQQQMREVSATATSARREVSVTVSQLGGLQDIKFSGNAHRKLAPQELASLIMETFQDAKEQAADRAAEIIAPFTPPGVDARELMAGRLGAEALVPPGGLRLPDAVRAQMRQ